MQKIVLAGGSGFLGRILARWFFDRGWEVVVISRSRTDVGPYRGATWDGETLGPCTAELDGADAVVNLAGRSVNCRYNARNRRAILDSRVKSTQVLGRALAECRQPPRVWLNSSTATIYRHSLDRPMDERTGEIGGTPEVKDVFSVEVATAWEQAFFSADVGLVRRAAMRTGIVLGNEPDTVFQVLRRLTRMGLGGTMGHGRQYVSWIHERDFCRAVEFLIGRDDLDGPVNIVAPNPVANAEMMRLFREVLHVRLGVPATRWMLEIGAFLMRTETELILKSRRVVPLRLQEAGFQFEYPKLQPALKELSDRASKTSVPPQKAAHR